MAHDASRAHVQIDEGGRMLATGDIERTADGRTRVSMHREPGHLPVGTSARLVDAVLDHPDVRAGEHVTAALPRGDDEALGRVRERCDAVETRAAGASTMVEADTR
jgi:hypothetical protein